MSRYSEEIDSSATGLARRALVTTLVLAGSGALLGVTGSLAGEVGVAETRLALASLLFSSLALALLMLWRRMHLQALATVTTAFFMLNLCVGMVVAAMGEGERMNLFVYLLWFFPLMILNRLVNKPAVGRVLAVCILMAPALIIAALVPVIRVRYRMPEIMLLGIFSLVYSCCAITVQRVMQYREKYIMERERAEALRIESRILEGIADAFLSLNAEARLVYLNDEACAELGVSRQAALQRTLGEAAPGFFSAETLAEFGRAWGEREAAVLERRHSDGRRWHEFRCFPQADGMSICFRNINQRKADEERIHKLAFYDVLTGLGNRQMAQERLGAALTDARTEGTMGVLLSIDLDDFRTMNNAMGHEMGDALLQQVALRLAAVCEIGDVAVRMGGDDFLVLLSERCETAEAAMGVARSAATKLLRMFDEPFEIGSYESDGTASIGVTLFGEAEDTVDKLFKQVELALYKAKSQGGNGVRYFAAEMREEVDARAALQSDLRQALARREIQLYYQPQVDGHRQVVGAEALLRWFHPLRGNVPAQTFIALAEEAGLISELGGWALMTACEQLAVWSQQPAMQELEISVNVSVRQFLEPRFVNTVMEILAATGARAQKLKMEITESCLMDKMDDVAARMRELRRLGIRFALDDFGTGYSSLSYLRHLPLDQLKIDRSFVRDVLTDPKDASIARTIVVLARSLELSVMAEGVETEPQRDFLHAAGCDLYQGFLYSRALPAGQFAEFVTMSLRVAQPVKWEPEQVMLR